MKSLSYEKAELAKEDFAELIGKPISHFSSFSKTVIDSIELRESNGKYIVWLIGEQDGNEVVLNELFEYLEGVGIPYDDLRYS